MTPVEAALHDAWQCVADAALEHDVAHERRALAELARLQQRRPTDEQ